MGRRLLTNTTASETIEPNTKVDEIIAYEKRIEDLRVRRALEKQKEEEHEMALQKDLGEEAEQAEEAEEVGKHGGIFGQASVNPLKPHLYPIQKQLRQVVYALRIAKSVVLWNESYYAFWLVTACFLTSIVFFVVPFGFISRWTMRIVAWVGLGPWNALIDRWYFRQNPNMTDAERDEALRLRLRARYEEMLLSTTNFFERKETAMKLKAIRKFMFGKFLLRVPRFCEDLYEDYPLPTSSCAPIDRKAMAPVSINERKFGQRLRGEMIPQREIQASHSKKDGTAQKTKRRFWQRKKHSSETTPLLADGAEEKEYG